MHIYSLLLNTFFLKKSVVGENVPYKKEFLYVHLYLQPMLGNVWLPLVRG